MLWENIWNSEKKTKGKLYVTTFSTHLTGGDGGGRPLFLGLTEGGRGLHGRRIVIKLGLRKVAKRGGMRGELTVTAFSMRHASRGWQQEHLFDLPTEGRQPAWLKGLQFNWKKKLWEKVLNGGRIKRRGNSLSPSSSINSWTWDDSSGLLFALLTEGRQATSWME